MPTKRVSLRLSLLFILYFQFAVFGCFHCLYNIPSIQHFFSQHIPDMRASIVLLIATAFSFSLAQAPAAPAVPNAPAAPAPPSAPAASSSSSPAPRKSQPARKPKKNKPQRSAHHGGHRRKHKNKRDDMSEMDDGLFEDLAAKDGGNAGEPLNLLFLSTPG